MTSMDTERTLLTARQVMQPKVITLHPDQEVVDAVQTLLRAGISGAPVVDDDGRVCGMFSERDSLTVLAAAAYDAEPSGKVADHMRPNEHTIDADRDVFELAQHFRDNSVRRTPVVDKDGRLIGLVLRSNVMRELHRLYFARAAMPPAEPRTPYERVYQQLQ